MSYEREDGSTTDRFENTPHGSRRAEVEALVATEETANVPIETYHSKLRTLADEVDELRGKLADVRMGMGCARGQRSTQFCAEAAQRDEIIGKLLEMWHGIQGQYMGSINDYTRALEIAGRKE